MRGFSDEVTPHYIVFESFGVRMEARASDPEILDDLKPFLPPIERYAEMAENVEDRNRFGIVREEDGRHSVWNPNTMVTTPQKTAFGSPVTKKPSPTRTPWIAAVRPVPMMVDDVTSRKRCRSFSVFFAEKGM